MKLDRYQKLLLTYALIVSILSFPEIKRTFFPEKVLENQSYQNVFEKEKVVKSKVNIHKKKKEEIKVKKKYRKQKDVIVAVLDTGIKYNHPFFKENMYYPKGKVSSTQFGFDLTHNKLKTTPHDTNGHGTHVAGIIKKMHKKVKLLNIKYFSGKQSGEDILNNSNKALKIAIENNVDIINYSGGGYFYNHSEYLLLKKAKEKGILVVVAAGNENSNIDLKKNQFYPASYELDNILVVNAHDKNYNIVSSSNWGKKVNITAPGHNIKSASLVSIIQKTSTGTSQATAFVSGVASLIKSYHPHLNYKEVKNIIIDSAIQRKKNIIFNPTFSSKKVSGILSKKKALNLADQRYKKRKLASIKKRENNE